jgi:hypothetical protein
MEMTKRSIVITVAAIVLAIATAAIAADDPFNGTWKLIKGGGNPPPKSLTYKIDVRGNTHKMMVDRVDPEGKPSHNDGTRMVDGRVHPRPDNPQTDSYRATRLDANTVMNEFMRDGKIVGTIKSVISNDGRTMTLVLKGKNAQGQDIDETEICEKQ